MKKWILSSLFLLSLTTITNAANNVKDVNDFYEDAVCQDLTSMNDMYLKGISPQLTLSNTSINNFDTNFDFGDSTLQNISANDFYMGSKNPDYYLFTKGVTSNGTADYDLNQSTHGSLLQNLVPKLTDSKDSNARIRAWSNDDPKLSSALFLSTDKKEKVSVVTTIDLSLNSSIQANAFLISMDTSYIKNSDALTSILPTLTLKISNNTNSKTYQYASNDLMKMAYNDATSPQQDVHSFLFLLPGAPSSINSIEIKESVDLGTVNVNNGDGSAARPWNGGINKYLNEIDNVNAFNLSNANPFAAHLQKSFGTGVPNVHSIFQWWIVLVMVLGIIAIWFVSTTITVFVKKRRANSFNNEFSDNDAQNIDL
ncbi:hypothetical protein ASO20_00075 [Mycoplasma sp. (ex Biomphalaria glabrata)]|uniref:hypothetical protein n=1 Tax=Mycoplasma sp. (ex Biomphalaria glabrata) TaxID=1749074 RepID=UPI00073AD8D5|nr:hypothetical protein [Mycoplasma sp. (ex Biomphalaria glabrata)]ALV23077.1 hypothetical protein ASO20_00075 [Mycoplasma sp. (ex Biomphalaria glabrata)]